MPASRFDPSPDVLDGVLAVLARERDYATELPGVLPPWPTRAQLGALVEMAFWASLRRDEGREATFALTWALPLPAPGQLRFAAPLALTPTAIAQLAPVLRTGQMSLGVTADGADGFSAWGILDAQVPVFVVVEALEPGLVVVREGGRTLALFVREQAHLINDDSLNAAKLLRQVLPLALSPRQRARRAEALARLAIAVRATGHGGTLLLVRGAPASWERYIQRPIRYAADPVSDVLAAALERADDPSQRSVGGADIPETPEALRAALSRGPLATGNSDVGSAVAFVASLTTVDGAVILDDALRVVGFGAKITAAAAPATVVAVQALGQQTLELTMEELGGTRHQSAARFVYGHHESVAIVASHDGDLSMLAWVADRNRVVVIQQTHAPLL